MGEPSVFGIFAGEDEYSDDAYDLGGYDDYDISTVQDYDSPTVGITEPGVHDTSLGSIVKVEAPWVSGSTSTKRELRRTPGVDLTPLESTINYPTELLDDLVKFYESLMGDKVRLAKLQNDANYFTTNSPEASMMLITLIGNELGIIFVEDK